MVACHSTLHSLWLLMHSKWSAIDRSALLFDQCEVVVAWSKCEILPEKRENVTVHIRVMIFSDVRQINISSRAGPLTPHEPKAAYSLGIIDPCYHFHKNAGIRNLCTSVTKMA